MSDNAYEYATPIGGFWIRPNPSFPDRAQLGVDQTPLGSFPSSDAAAEAVRERKTGFRAWDTNPAHPAPQALSDWSRGK